MDLSLKSAVIPVKQQREGCSSTKSGQGVTQSAAEEASARRSREKIDQTMHDHERSSKSVRGTDILLMLLPQLLVLLLLELLFVTRMQISLNRIAESNLDRDGF